MINKKVIEIGSLSEYIKYVTDNNLKNFISRGENRKFENITASAFRYSKPLIFYEQIDEFYNIIGNDITDMQKDNFVAFSQHHGIPTNLVDFSRSPLVSLFFACYGANQGNNSGYVYFVDSSRLINIDETLINKNILQMLLDFDSSVLPIIIKLYQYTDTHAKEIKHIISSFISKLEDNDNTRKKYENVIKYIEEMKNKEYSLYEYEREVINKIMAANCSDITGYCLQEDDINIFYNLVKNITGTLQYVYLDTVLLVIILIKVVLTELYDFSDKKEISSIELPFYFSYCPPNILTRVSNQSSLFIYQLFYDDNIPDYYIDKAEDRIVQDIVPDYIFKINNQNDILSDLDTMGINLKFIYNDYDNIAKYIKNGITIN